MELMNRESESRIAKPMIRKWIDCGNDICKEIVEYMVLEVAYGILYANDKHYAGLRSDRHASLTCQFSLIVPICTITNMPPINVIISRMPLPGNIRVTPIPIEAPIHTRPILQSHPYLAIISTITKSTAKATRDHFNWPVFLLFVFFVSSLAFILSEWGWRHFTGRIWKCSSKWDGPLEDLDEEHLLPETHSEEPETSKITTTSLPTPMASAKLN
jgi:hypothetical protein